MSEREWNETTLSKQRRHALTKRHSIVILRHTSERMFKTRLAQWGYLKKMRDIDWQAVAVLHKQRLKAGQKTSSFMVHGRRIKLADLGKYLKDQKISEDDLLVGAAANDITELTIPDYIRCFTPTISTDLASAVQSSGQESSTPEQSPTRELVGTTICGSNSPVMSMAANSEPYEIVDKCRSTSSGTSSSNMSTSALLDPQKRISDDGIIGVGSNVAVHHLPPLNTEAVFCDAVQQDLGSLLVRGLTPDSLDLSAGTTDGESWTFLNHLDESGGPTVLCSRCHQRLSNHLPFPSEFLWSKENFMPRSMFFHNVHLTSPISQDADLGSIWMACCFGACIFARQEEFDYVAKSLSRADVVFQEMLVTRNSALLTSVNATLTILHAHNQGKMAMSVIRSALHVAQTLLGTEHSISIILEWMTALAWRQLPQCRVTTSHLRAIYHQFETLYGTRHPYTLAILYNLAFNLIRDKSFEEAEELLRQLSQGSRLTLGPSHLQTITALTTLSRALASQKKFEEAIKVRIDAIDIGRRTLGPNHPHQLESMRRLALVYKEQGKDVLMEPIYWAVLKGRIKSLGPKNDFTEGAMEDLIELLKKLGKWDQDGETKRTIDELFEHADESSSDHEAF